MHPDPRFWRTKRVCVTGGSGFLGWHLTRLLLPIAAHVRIFGLPPRSAQLKAQLHDLDCVYGDIRDSATARRALADCDVVFHTAGPVGVWGKALVHMHDIHVDGTRQIVTALQPHARLVHTSSVVAVGASRGLEPLTEAAPFQLHDLKVDYVHAKKAAEEVVLAAARSGCDAVVVNPSYLIGPDDFEGSVMGRFCVRCWRGKVPLIPPGGLNLADVRDVALGHLLAAERGAAGQRYILGGADRLMADFVHQLAQTRGLSSRWWLTMPNWLHAVIACGAELRAHCTGREPYPSRQHVRVSRLNWFYSSARAEAELGYQPRSLTEALHETHAWYCQRGVLKPRADRLQHETPLREAA